MVNQELLKFTLLSGKIMKSYEASKEFVAHNELQNDKNITQYSSLIFLMTLIDWAIVFILFQNFQKSPVDGYISPLGYFVAGIESTIVIALMVGIKLHKEKLPSWADFLLSFSNLILTIGFLLGLSFVTLAPVALELAELTYDVFDDIPAVMYILDSTWQLFSKNSYITAFFLMGSMLLLSSMAGAYLYDKLSKELELRQKITQEKVFIAQVDNYQAIRRQWISAIKEYDELKNSVLYLVRSAQDMVFKSYEIGIAWVKAECTIEKYYRFPSFRKRPIIPSLAEPRIERLDEATTKLVYIEAVKLAEHISAMQLDEDFYHNVKNNADYYPYMKKTEQGA